jgi:hypothetical protein
MALNKALEELTEADLTVLIASRIEERRTLDYKLILPGNSSDNSKEFVADVSSFANTAGGHLIYGMREENGVAVELVGVEGDSDAEMLRLDNRIRDGIAPRIPSEHMKAVRLSNSKWALVIRIQKSLISPHMVTLGGRKKFYARASNGRFELDVDQLRSAFLNSESIASKIREFRVDRIARIKSGDTPIPLMAGPYIVLHILPVGAFSSPLQTDILRLVADARVHQVLAPLHQEFANDRRINLDGFVVYQIREEGKALGYTQLYRNGAIESVDWSFIYSSGPVIQGGQKVLASLDFEQGLIAAVERFLGVLRFLAADPPLVLMLTLIGVKGWGMALGGRPFRHNEFDRDILMIPELVVENLGGNVGTIIKPILDSVWNASGGLESPYYENGVWAGSRRGR